MFNRKKFNEKAFNAPSYIFKPAKAVLTISFSQHDNLKVKRIAECLLKLNDVIAEGVLRIKNTSESSINLGFKVCGELSDGSKNVCVVKIVPRIKTSGINKGHLMANINNAIILKSCPRRYMASDSCVVLNMYLSTHSAFMIGNKSLSKLSIHAVTDPFKKIFTNSCVPVYFVSIPKNTRCIFYTDKVHGNYKNKHSFNTDPLNKVPFNGKGSSTKLGTFNVNIGVLANSMRRLSSSVDITQYLDLYSKAFVQMREQLDILPVVTLKNKGVMRYKEDISLETAIALMADYWTFGWREVPAYKIIWRWSR